MHAQAFEIDKVCWIYVPQERQLIVPTVTRKLDILCIHVRELTP